MRIVIDLQGAQGRNARRGIGRYSLALAQAMARQAQGRHEVLIALNGAFPESIEPLRDAFAQLLPAHAVRVWDSPAPAGGEAGPGMQRAAARLREAFLASLAPDVVHVSSLFESPRDGASISCGLFAPLPTAVTLYDLIPLLRPETYLAHPAARAEYDAQLAQLRRADLLLAISAASREEALTHLQLAPGRCVNISTAADAHFVPQRLDGQAQDALRARYGLGQPFVMYTGGIDARKNIEGLVRAFALLPAAVRDAHQLAVVCSVQDESRRQLLALAEACGLAPGQLVLTGYVPEPDLVGLYNLCAGFVFPSLHEGFGLPALEAMRCGAPVIASNTSSLPEVVGRSDALFDPTSDAAIAASLERLLTDTAWREALRAHGLEQASRFSWDESARRALEAMEGLVGAAPTPALPQGGREDTPSPALPREVGEDTPSPTLLREGGVGTPSPALAQGGREKTRLAFVSPLPPERTGIADYSAELLPELARHYAIDVVVDQAEIADPWVQANCQVLTPQQFLRDAGRYDRVLYHFGNSAFHQHMFPLLEQVPGVVVLHDFFLSGVQAWRQNHGDAPLAWWTELLEGHGYHAFARAFRGEGAKVVYAYPASHGVLRDATGVIVHSPHSEQLAREWYGDASARHWVQIPLLRQPGAPMDRNEARRRLGVAEDDFVVCSFGLLGPTKNNLRLVEAWCASRLAHQPNCRLVFVGENQDSEYGRSVERAIASRGNGRIQITGWASPEDFRHWLHAADLGVQLRQMSRGETSAAVLDCMNHGLPTVVNANGSMAYLPQDAVCMIPDDFQDGALVDALETLWSDRARREGLGARAQAFVRSEHSPAACAAAYVAAIERFHADSARGRNGLLEQVALHDALDEEERRSFAVATNRSLPELPAGRQLFLDISELVLRDAGTGIQRVVKKLMGELLAHPPAGFRVEPVYATEGEQGYRHARRFTTRFLGCPTDAFRDDPVDFQAGDLFLGLDLQPARVPEQAGFLARMRHAGVRTAFVVYDLLPILQPQHFTPGAEVGHSRWMEVVAQADGLIGISESVSREVAQWLEQVQPARSRHPLGLGWFHLGADVHGTQRAALTPEDERLVARLTRERALLMVGTIEPRKGHAQALDACEALWARGNPVHLVIVGKPGWMVDDLVERLRNHPERDQRLFWLERADDAVLEALYARSCALIAASHGEGFGLPLVEAAQHSLPLIARDIPVFREVAGDHAFYFQGSSGEALAQGLEEWLQLHARGAHPRSDALPWLTWAQSARQLVDVVVQEGWQSRWKRA